MFTFRNVQRVHESRSETVLDPFRFTGHLIFNHDTQVDIDFLRRTYNEAQVKYARMHADRPLLRFDKSWTGVVGEEIVKHIITQELGFQLSNNNQVIDAQGYDGGDVRFTENGVVKIINVSSRKLSLQDSIENVLNEPDKYFALIPTDQLNQYTIRSNYAYFVFLLFNNANQVNVNIGDNITINLYTAAEWIVPGFLKNTDLTYMNANSFLFTKLRNSNLNGLYGDLAYNINMYTNNYVIFIPFLRRFT